MDAPGAIQGLERRVQIQYAGLTPGRGRLKTQPALRAPDGVAAIPATAIDPPHRAASPAVPALIGSGSPSISFGGRFSGANVFNLSNRLKLTQVFLAVLSKPTNNSGVSKEFGDITLGAGQMQIINAIAFLN